jgi:selenide,water dikinase
MIRLTQTVQKGGCAAKVAAPELRKILSALTFPPKPPELLVDGALFDDAAIFQISDSLALVQTLDFFTPIVDNPRTFGKVAAANALSDVYAMGGTPKTAMAILAFPLATMESEVVVEVLQGACDLMAEAGVALVGGHSIDDDTLKFGLSVTGHVHPKKIWANAGAKAGDVLILTKALGTGTATAALKRSAVGEEAIAHVLDSMSQLNNVPELLGTRVVHAATDITGFGITGHAMQMANASGVTLALDFSRLPVFQGVWDWLREGFLTKAHASNAAYVKERLRYEGNIPEEKKPLLFDPQTSGGLLLSVPRAGAELILQTLCPRFPAAAIVGEVLPFSGTALVLRA